MIPPSLLALADQAQAQSEDLLALLLDGLGEDVPEFLPYLSYLADELTDCMGLNRDQRFLLPLVVTAVRWIATAERENR